MQEAADPAVRRAREVVGLYGDPTVTWGIALDLRLSRPLEPDAVRAGAGRLVAAHPHLGRAPAVAVAAPEQWEQAVLRLTTEAYGDHDPLVRVLVGEDGLRLAVGAHHGACDGLGLVATASVSAGLDLATTARGIGDRASSRSFLLSSAARLGEALLDPPARFAGTRSPTGGEQLAKLVLPPLRVGTAGVAHALVRTVAERRRRGAMTGRRVVLSYGASRRAPGALAPDRQTAYFRLVADPRWSRERLAARMGEIEPEPTFPETSAGGIGPRVTRVLRGRLGATAIISNLGRLEAPGLESAAMYPAASGPQSAAFGFTSTPRASTLTLRTRRADFTPEESQRLLAEVAGHLRDA